MRNIDVSNLLSVITAILILIRSYHNYRREYSFCKIYKYLYILSHVGIAIVLLFLAGCIYVLNSKDLEYFFFCYALVMVFCCICMAQTFIIECKLDCTFKGIPLGKRYRWLSTWKKIEILIELSILLVASFLLTL